MLIQEKRKDKFTSSTQGGDVQVVTEPFGQGYGSNDDIPLN